MGFNFLFIFFPGEGMDYLKNFVILNYVIPLFIFDVCQILIVRKNGGGERESSWIRYMVKHIKKNI